MIKNIFLISSLMLLFSISCSEKSFNNPTVPDVPNQKPIAVIKASPTTSETPPLEVQFDGLDSHDQDGNIVSYHWDFGDDTSGTGGTISHTYDKAGTYTTTLTVTDDAGDTGTTSVSIIIDCDIVHKGDLVIKGDETFEIKDCVYCQHGNIFVRNKAILIIRDAVLKMIQPSFQEYVIYIYASASMENANLSSNYSFGMQVSGMADFTNCEMKNDSRLFSVENGKISVKKSKLGGICFQGNSKFVVEDSEILDLVDIDALFTQNASIKISGLEPGFINYWNTHENMTINGPFADLTLKSTNVSRWSVRPGGKNTAVEIRDSKVDWLRFGHSHEPGKTYPGGLTTVKNSEIGRVSCGDYDGGPLVFSNTQLKDFSITYCMLNIQGTVTFTGDITEWKSGIVKRDFPVRVKDSSGGALLDVALELYSPDGTLIWAGKSDYEGRTIFEITFNDENYKDTWELKAPNLDISSEVEFRTKTPIVVKKNN